MDEITEATQESLDELIVDKIVLPDHLLALPVHKIAGGS